MRAGAVLLSVVLCVATLAGVAVGQSQSNHCLYGRLYWDRDKNGAWTPRRVSDPMVEWLPRIPVEALANGVPVAQSVTRANGGYAVCAPSGLYDLRFAGQFTVPGVYLGDTSVDVGETAVKVQRGDINRDLRFDKYDIMKFMATGKFLTGQPATWGEGDFTGDGIVDSLDKALVMESKQAGLYVKSPEPAGIALLLSAVFILACGSRSWRFGRSRV